MAEIIPFKKVKKTEVTNNLSQSGVVSLAEFKEKRLEDKIARWKNKTSQEKKNNFWAEFIGQKFVFNPAFPAQALPDITLSNENSKEDFPTMRFREGKFLAFDSQFGGIFAGNPVNDPTDLGKCYFLVPEEMLKYLISQKKKG